MTIVFIIGLPLVLMLAATFLCQGKASRAFLCIAAILVLLFQGGCVLLMANLDRHLNGSGKVSSFIIVIIVELLAFGIWGLSLGATAGSTAPREEAAKQEDERQRESGATDIAGEPETTDPDAILKKRANKGEL